MASCLYAVSKITAGNLIDYYRKKHHNKASIYYLFNHESKLRNKDYFISKIVNTLKNALEDSLYRAEFQTLNFYCDWGCAIEYMKLMYDASVLDSGHDLIIASGKTTYARRLVEELFEIKGLDYRNHVVEINHLQGDIAPYQVDISNLIKTVGTPNTDIFKVIQEML
jgi:GDP-D-mannose dehydratase